MKNCENNIKTKGLLLLTNANNTTALPLYNWQKKLNCNSKYLHVYTLTHILNNSGDLILKYCQRGKVNSCSTSLLLQNYTCWSCYNFYPYLLIYLLLLLNAKFGLSVCSTARKVSVFGVFLDRIQSEYGKYGIFNK